MNEKLDTFDLKGKFLGTQDRNEFYSEIKDEFIKNGVITRKVKTIRLILMNSAGRIYLQKRSKIKTENSGLYDKTVGGHISSGDSSNLTVVRECAEELGFPATVLLDEEFKKATTTTSLEIVGIFKKVDEISNFESTRIIKGDKIIIQPMDTAIFIGYYDGAIRFADGESSGIEVFSLDELNEDMKSHPEKFTEDIKFMIKKYEKYFQNIKTNKEF